VSKETSHAMEANESPDWLISYSDLMSLLLCLFILLYAVSAVQDTKIQSATASLRSGFGLFATDQISTAGEPRQERKRVALTIPFDIGDDDLSEKAKNMLEALYEPLMDVAANPEYTIQIIGQAEWGEASAYRRDLDLAYARSISVWDYLVSLGIDRERLQIVQQAGRQNGSLVEIRNVR